MAQRRRHFWRLDTKSITLYQNETGKHFYKELPLADVLAVESAKGISIRRQSPVSPSPGINGTRY